MASALQTSLALNVKCQTDVSLHGSRLPELINVRACINSSSRQAIRTKNHSKLVRSNSWLLHRRKFSDVHPARLQPLQAQLVQFKSSRQVSIPCREGTLPAAEYLKEVERVVKIAFPDSARISYEGDSVWRSRLKPITFFTISATPVCHIKVYNDDGVLRIYSDRLSLDFMGLPQGFENLNLKFSLGGQLQANSKNKSQYKPGRLVDFTGAVSLGLKVNLPSLFSLLPESLLTAVGDRILDTILGAMEAALVRGIPDDYRSWCWAQQTAESNRTLKVTS